MSANDGDLVDRLAKKHSVSSAAVQVVLAALRSGGGRMARKCSAARHVAYRGFQLEEREENNHSIDRGGFEYGNPNTFV